MFLWALFSLSPDPGLPLALDYGPPKCPGQGCLQKSFELKPGVLVAVFAPSRNLEESCRWGGQGAGTVLLCCLSS